MTILTLFQVASLVSVSLACIWSVVKITRAIVGLVSFCSRIMREHDVLWQEYEERHGINERADAAAI
jgi:hypothetical protein